MTYTTQKGFTLVEMLTVLAIFSLMTAIVIFNYNKFRSDTILTNMAYEIALTIREAQIYGVSVRGGGSAVESFQKAYGVHLDKDSGQYFLFVDGDNNGLLGGTCPSGAINPDSCVTPYTMQRKVIVSNIKVNDCIQNISDIDVVFKRPNPEPTIRTSGNNDIFNQTEITIESSEGTKRYINVYGNGQIAVLTSPELCI